jgi:ABC-2 type transport system permease protein
VIWRTAQRTARDSWRGGTAPLVSVVVAVVMVALGAAAMREADTDRAARDAANRAERQAWLEQGEKSPHSAAHDGLYLSRPLPPLAWLDRGVDPVVGALTRLEVHEAVRFDAPPIAERPVSQRLIDISMGTIWQILVPLLIGVLVATALAREREHGTLAWIAVSGARTLPIALGVVLGAVAPPAATTIAILFPFAALMTLQSDTSFWITLGSVIAAHGIWWLMAASFATVTALRAPSTAHALAVVVVVWVSTVLLAPSLAAGITEAWVPTPSSFEIGERIVRARAALPSLYQRIERLERETVPADTKLRTPKGRALLEEEADLNHIADVVGESLTQVHHRQQSIRRWLSVALPVLAIQDVSSRLVGTDVGSLRRFEGEAEAYRRTMVRLLNEAEAEFGDANAAPFLPAYLAGTDVWRRLDEFSSAPSGVQDEPARRWSIGVLVAWTVVLVAWSGRLAKRWRP